MEIITSFLPILSEHKRYKFAFGGRGSGKSVQFAIAVLIAGLSGAKRILCAREIQKSIKDSVHTLLGDIIAKNELPYTILNNEIKGITGTEIIFTGLRDHTAATVKSYEGIDICWVEEAQAVSQKSLDILMPTIRKSGSELWFTYNRLLEIDPVHALMRQTTGEGRRRVLSLNGAEYPFMRYDGPDALGLGINYDGNPYFTDELRKDMLRDKAENFDLYLHKWEGEPENQGGYALIPRSIVKEAVGRQVRDWQFWAFGVDPARYGDDESVICIRHGLRILPLITLNGINTMGLTGIIVDKSVDIYAAGYKDAIDIMVDETGVGGGVIDRLVELSDAERIKPDDQKRFNFNVVACVNNGEAINAKYKDFGAESWGGMKDALPEISIPDDEILFMQLTSRKYKIESDGRIKLERKEDYKKRGFKSPDRADALALCLWRGNNIDLDGLSIENVKR